MFSKQALTKRGLMLTCYRRLSQRSVYPVRLDGLHTLTTLQFQNITKTDAQDFKKVAGVALPQLPDWYRLKEGTRVEMEKAIADLKKLFQEQVDLNRSRGFPQSNSNLPETGRG